MKMRKEIIHLLQNMKDEEVMMSVLRNLNKNDLLMLVDYLNFTSAETKKRWNATYIKMLHSVNE